MWPVLGSMRADSGLLGLGGGARMRPWASAPSSSVPLFCEVVLVLPTVAAVSQMGRAVASRTVGARFQETSVESP